MFPQVVRAHRELATSEGERQKEADRLDRHVVKLREDIERCVQIVAGMFSESSSKQSVALRYATEAGRLTAALIQDTSNTDFVAPPGTRPELNLVVQASCRRR